MIVTKGGDAMKALAVFVVTLALAAAVAGQEPAAPVKQLTVEPGTRIPLQLINRVSSKNAQPGDQVYLQTAFPIVVNGRTVIPSRQLRAGDHYPGEAPGPGGRTRRAIPAL